MLETKEKYVTEDMLEKALDRFGKNLYQDLRRDIRQDVREDIHVYTKEIIDTAINDFAIIVWKHFDRLDKKIDDGLAAVDGRMNERFDKVDARFIEVDKRFDIIEHRLDMIDNRFDNHLLECVRRDEHQKLDKRVGAVEMLQRKLAA
jgi:hypothetical protein